MKKLLAAVLLGISGMAFATDNTANIQSVGQDAYWGNLTNESALASSKTYTYDLGPNSIRKISAEVHYASAAMATGTFTDGRTSAGTVTVLSTASLCGTIFTLNTSSFNFGGCAPYDSRTATIVTIGANVTATAGNLCKAITQTNTATLAIATCTVSSGIISLVSKTSGVNAYAMTSSGSSVTVNATAMASGVAPTYSSATDRVQITGHGYGTGLNVTYAKGTNNISGLVNGTIYYVIYVDSNNIKLASTYANAVAETAVDISVQLASATASSPTLTPVSITGTPSYIWQMSNDGTNFVAYTSSGGIYNMNVTDTYAAYDFTDFGYRWLRLNATPPATGAVKLDTWLYTKH